jgi:beta-galactosidase
MHPNWRLTGLLGFLLLIPAATCLADREIIPLDSDWRFIRQDAGLSATSADWERVRIPHTWNARDGQDGPDRASDRQEARPVPDKGELNAEAAARARKNSLSGDIPAGKDPHLANGYYRGACWYEHPLAIPADWKGKKRVFVRFDAAGTVAKVYLNKTLLGEHRGGFTAFCYELTDRLRYGAENELRVQVDNSYRDDLPPLSGDFNLDGGLYRPVTLLVTDEVCISPLDYASPGVYLTTRSLDDKQAEVEVLTLVSNGNKASDFSKQADKTPGAAVAGPEKAGGAAPQAAASRTITLRTEIKDAAGLLIAEITSMNAVPAETTVPVKQLLTIRDPHRWNGRSDPYLYTVAVMLLDDGRAVDQVTQPLGLRTAAITQEQGFLLNGRPYPVHGVSRHQDLRNKGWALSPEDEERDAAIMKEMGVTAVRDAHYPQSEHWHSINDREGVLLWDELSLVNETRSSRAFWLNSEESLREMIRQLYNHPSIVWWGLFNELGNRPMPPSDAELARLQEIAKELDPNRIVVSASCHDNRSFNHVTEQIGFNHYPGWYDAKSPSSMRESIENRSGEVGKRIAISEYGAGANIAQHVEGTPVHNDPRGPFHPEEFQNYSHELMWDVMKENPRLWGTFVWNMFDFACKGRHEGNFPSLNDKGLVTHDRQFKKDAFYFYKANWNPEPMVHITSRRAVNRTQPSTEVKVYSTCPEVHLTVNGKDLGAVKPDGNHVARWPSVTLQPGRNSIMATGDSKGTPVSDSCEWILEAAPKS